MQADKARLGWIAVLAAAVLAAACGGGGGGGGNDGPRPTLEVAPVQLPGPYPVGCSNLAQDFSRVPAGVEARDYWVGKPASDGRRRYISDLLTDPANTLAVQVRVPDTRRLFGDAAGRTAVFVLVACYPTATASPRADYPLTSGSALPHMQTGTEAPLFAEPAARLPLLVYSHGYGGSPVSGDYLTVLKNLASHGYVVVAPFHADPAVSDLSIDDFADAVRVLSRFDNFVAVQALRPLVLSAAIDLMLSHPHWRDHVDAARIGGFGVSMGGEAMLLLAGAGLTSSASQDWSRVMVDARLKAAVGYVPYFGQPFLPAFGRDQQGLDGIALPFLAIAGASDTTAPLPVTETGIRRLSGGRELVALAGVAHEYDAAAAGDLFTWALTFLDAEVRGDAEAARRLAVMARVAGGNRDSVVVPWGTGGY